MKKAGIITFHASHNYGSVLQTYALQTKINELGFECEIINFRTNRQKDIYSLFTKRKGLRYILKNAAHMVFYRDLRKKHDRFENFIINNLNISLQKYENFEQIMQDPPLYDFYISGSDQIWNPIPADFDWAYYLPFVRTGKRIAYAPSFGPIGKIEDINIKRYVGDYIKNYDYISVREEHSKKIADSLANCNAKIVLDPTLLLNNMHWQTLTKDSTNLYPEYILFYTLFADREMIEIVSEISKKLQLPVIITNLTNQYDFFAPFKKQLNTGPNEFLSLIRKANLVCTSSFHGTIFSIIFKRPFLAIRGIRDKRISSLLKLTKLENRTIDLANAKEKINIAYEIDYSNALKSIKLEQQKSLLFLRNALRIKE